MKMTTWRVRLYWQEERGCFEGGADTAFPASATAIDVIHEVARWRNINLSICTMVEAVRGRQSDEWDVPHEIKETK